MHMSIPIALAVTAVCVAVVGKAVGCSVVEAFGDNPKPQELQQVLRLEYRSKLLNPKVALTPLLQLPTYCVCISVFRLLRCSDHCSRCQWLAIDIWKVQQVSCCAAVGQRHGGSGQWWRV